MAFSTMGQFLEYFQTDRVIKVLHDLNVGALIHNPIFLGGMAAVAIIALFMRWRVILIIVLSLVGVTGLVAYTLQQGTGLGEGMHTDNLFIFVVAGAGIIFFVIYLLFIRGD